MIGLDNDAVIAAFQTAPPQDVAVYRDRIRAFLFDRLPEPVMMPAVVLSEYLVGFDTADRRKEFAEVANNRVLITPFDSFTAEIAADLGRRLIDDRVARGEKPSLGGVAVERGTHRISLKNDIHIVATAVQHGVRTFITNDRGCHSVATFAGLHALLLSELPDPRPTSPLPPAHSRDARQASLFDPPGSGEGPPA